jgi:hypothetical protein
MTLASTLVNLCQLTSAIDQMSPSEETAKFDGHFAT